MQVTLPSRAGAGAPDAAPTVVPRLDRAAVKAFARGLGFDLVGVASAAPFAAEAEVLRERERRQARSPFEHPDIALRTEPHRLLPGARSFVAVAACYRTPREDAGTPPGAASGAPPGEGQAAGGDAATAERPTGRLSRYARGRDYHRVLRERLARLAAWIEAEAPGARTRVSVDTDAPIDRAVAARAGVGWFGKNCSLIVPPHGSWVFLGEVLTDAEIEPDQPLAQHCGHCRLCVDACPTGALRGPHDFDASRCLSQLSQNRGSIPIEFRRAMSDMLFGCDICQDVCPHNKAARPADHPEFQPLPGLEGRIDLARLLRMGNDEFRRLFGASAASWRGRTVLQRNAVVALGNSAHPAALEPLRAALRDGRPIIRGHAAWALGTLGGHLGGDVAAAARAALAQRAAVEEVAEVKEEISLALAALAQAAQRS